MVTFVELVFWIFAFKYFELSMKLRKMIEGQQPKTRLNPKLANRVIITYILLLPLLVNICYIIASLNNTVGVKNFVNIMGFIFAILELVPYPVTCCVTWIAFKEITKVTDNSQFETKPRMIKLNIAA